MALTTQQEEVLALIIEAFENGKRLSDLPTAKGTNPFDLLVEVLDTDGESKKATLAQFLPYIEEQCSYGIEFDTTISAPECTRIGNTDLHKTLPIQGRMRGCLLDDNGKVVEYLDPSDWSNNVLDGSRGQVMVEIPMHYRRFVTNGTKRQVKLSEYPLPGYHTVPLHYMSAFEATVERSTQKLASVVNLSADFRGGNNNEEWDNTYRTLLGMPATSISRTNYRKYARNRNAATTAEWNMQTYDSYKTLYWLFVVEYATLNSQAAYNPELTAEGLRQGGLGVGVTNTSSSAWEEFNSNYPFVPCGITNSLGNTTGVVAFTATNADGTVFCETNVPRYRGIENPFGHIFKWTDGVNIRISPDEANGGDGLSKIFTCSDPENFSDTGYDNYSYVGNEARDEGYVKAVVFGEFGEIVPEETGGGSKSYFCDYHYTNIPTTTEALRGLLFGGNSISGAVAGFACAASIYAPSISAASLGSRLCFIPE